MVVEFERVFQAAHRLSRHRGKCSRIHGHNYRLRAMIEVDRLGSDGFAIEFERVKEIVDQFDHRLILWANDGHLEGLPDDWIVRVPEDPTTEYLARWFAETLAKAVVAENDRAQVIAVKVELRETDSIMATHLVNARGRGMAGTVRGAEVEIVGVEL
jgi:6-pyruvoyltetrahydropterin/6-carboxytetrahydropterin synthase